MKNRNQISLPTSSLTFLVASLSFVYLNGLFNHGLIPSMEPRFAEVITEMMAAGQYLIPIKNGIPYVEYPPLLYWLAIILAKLGLPVEAAIRLPCYVAFIAWVLFMDKLQGLFWQKWPAITLPLLGAALPAILWHFFTAQTDALLITGVLIAFVGFAELRLERTGTGFPWKLWLGVALATAAKGPVGVACTLPIMVLEVFVASVLEREAGSSFSQWMVRTLNEMLRLAWFRGLALLGITVVFWYLLSGYYYGWDFIRAVVVYQNFERYLTGFDHSQPWWYYFEAVLAGMFPISLFVPLGIWAAVRRVRNLPERLVLIWALWTFLFFTISASKQGKYILPAAPAFLVLGIFGVEALFKQSLGRVMEGLRRWAIGLIAVWGVLVVAVLPFYSAKIAHVEGFAVIRQTISDRPANLVQFGWPRSLTLYELGAPIDYVRSSRELYQNIHSGKMREGDYLLVAEKLLPAAGEEALPGKLWPAPAPPWFEHVLSVKAGSKVQLFRVMPGAAGLPVPPTPEPETLNWRDMQFDTD